MSHRQNKTAQPRRESLPFCFELWFRFIFCLKFIRAAAEGMKHEHTNTPHEAAWYSHEYSPWYNASITWDTWMVKLKCCFHKNALVQSSLWRVFYFNIDLFCVLHSLWCLSSGLWVFDRSLNEYIYKPDSETDLFHNNAAVLQAVETVCRRALSLKCVSAVSQSSSSFSVCVSLSLQTQLPDTLCVFHESLQCLSHTQTRLVITAICPNCI